MGNMKTNARGDELGAGGQVVKTRAQLMQEYHKLNTPVAAHDDVVATSISATPTAPVTKLVQPTADDTPVAVSAPAPTAEYTKPRGSFAGAVATETEVKQVLLDPLPGVTPGVKRI